jgi:hypothetical protein
VSTLVAALQPNASVSRERAFSEVNAIVSIYRPVTGFILCWLKVSETLQHVFVRIPLVTGCNHDKVDNKSLFL